MHALAPRGLAALKVVHTAAWFSIESCVVYLLFTGLAGHSDRRAAIAAGVVFGETALFTANSFRCPQRAGPVAGRRFRLRDRLVSAEVVRALSAGHPCPSACSRGVSARPERTSASHAADRNMTPGPMPVVVPPSCEVGRRGGCRQTQSVSHRRAGFSTVPPRRSGPRILPLRSLNIRFGTRQRSMLRCRRSLRQRHGVKRLIAREPMGDNAVVSR